MAQIYRISNSQKNLPDLTKFQHPKEVLYWFWNFTGATLVRHMTYGKTGFGSSLARLRHKSRQ
jgi:hypothetical protein